MLVPRTPLRPALTTQAVTAHPRTATAAPPPPQASRLFAPPADPREFFTDFQALLKMTSSGPVKTFCHHRCVMRVA